MSSLSSLLTERSAARSKPVSGMENDEHQPPAQDSLSGMPQRFHLQMHGFLHC